MSWWARNKRAETALQKQVSLEETARTVQIMDTRQKTKHSQLCGGGELCRKPSALSDWLKIWGKGGVSLLGVDTRCRALKRQWRNDEDLHRFTYDRWPCGNSQRSGRVERWDVGGQDVLATVQVVQRSRRLRPRRQMADKDTDVTSTTKMCPASFQTQPSQFKLHRLLVNLREINHKSRQKC